MPWTIVYHQAAAEELAQQPADIRAKLDYIAELVVVFGLQHLPGKYARHLRGPLWEFRLKGKDGIARALYVTGRGQRVIIVRVFAKKTQKTPPREIKLALGTGQRGCMTRKTGKLRQRKPRLVPHDEVYAKWRKDADFQLARAELADEFALVAELIRARTKAGLTQSQVADRMKSTQPAIARLESSGRVPSTRTLQRYARATGHRLRITLVPDGTKAR